MYYNQNPKFLWNYEANLTTVITWGSNSVIYNLFTCDITFPANVTSWDVSVTSSTLKAFMKF